MKKLAGVGRLHKFLKVTRELNFILNVRGRFKKDLRQGMEQSDFTL